MCGSRYSAFTWGTARRASTAARTKNDMKPSFTPYRSWNTSLNLARSAITADMSTSLKVVSRAACCWASTSRSAIRRRIGELDTLLGRRIGRVHLVGGGVKNRLLCQMIADATGRPVVAGPVEATAIGNLLVQLTARAGVVDLRAMREIVRQSFEPETFEPRAAAAWDARLGR